MKILNKLVYGFKQIFLEVTGKEDYWHLRLKPQAEDSHFFYLHKMKNKGYYPGQIDNGIPIFYIDGKYPVYFYTTIINYGLGLLERSKNENNIENDIKKIAQWLIDSQKGDGSWRYNFPTEANHSLAADKPSGMSQGLAISFLIRVRRLGLINAETALNVIEKAVLFMESDIIISEIDGNKFIQEFYVPGKSELNGAIFALYGLYDYGIEINDLEKFNYYLNSMKNLLKHYKFHYWSFYNMDGTISSRFYHQLHLDMIEVLFNLTKDPIFQTYIQYWKRGLKFSAIFILLKSFQKLLTINKMPMSYASKSTVKYK